MTLTYAVTDAADADVRKQIVAPLIRFNESHAGPVDFLCERAMEVLRSAVNSLARAAS